MSSLPPPRKKQKTAPSDQDLDDPSPAPAVLTTELIARVASFVPYGTDAMNVCLAVGPKDSAIIRYTCLRNNMKYLKVRLKQYIDKEVGIDHVATYALAWMAVNTDWRKLCTADNRRKFAIVSFKRDDEDEEYTYIFNTLALFNNPMLAIEFDLVDVLKHLVEEVGIDINAYEWNSYTYEGPKRIHLLASAFYRENCFQYLIKRGDLDVFSYFFHPGHGDGSREDLFQVALRFEDIKHSVFQAIVCHGNFDPNTPRRQEDDGPFPGLLLRPLQFALACIDEGHFDEDIDEMEEKFKILLTETGADPSLDTADCPSAIDFALKTFTLANHKHRERWSRIISAMKQRHPNLAVPDRLERRYRDLSRFSPY